MPEGLDIGKKLHIFPRSVLRVCRHLTMVKSTGPLASLQAFSNCEMFFPYHNFGWLHSQKFADHNSNKTVKNSHNVHFVVQKMLQRVSYTPSVGNRHPLTGGSTPLLCEGKPLHREAPWPAYEHGSLWSGMLHVPATFLLWRGYSRISKQ